MYTFHSWEFAFDRKDVKNINIKMIDCSDVFGFQAQIIVQAQFWFEKWRDALPCKKYLGNKAEIRWFD